MIRPGVVNLLERVATARDRSRAETRSRVKHLLDPGRRAELDGLLALDPVLGRTRLAWLGVGPTQANPAAVKAELAKLAYLRALDAHTLDLSVLPAQRRRFLAGVGSRSTAAGDLDAAARSVADALAEWTAAIAAVHAEVVERSTIGRSTIGRSRRLVREGTPV